jgi:hypothetical protein
MVKCLRVRDDLSVRHADAQRSQYGPCLFDDTRAASGAHRRDVERRERLERLGLRADAVADLRQVAQARVAGTHAVHAPGRERRIDCVEEGVVLKQ